MLCHVEVDRFGVIGPKVRTSQEGEPCHVMERCFRFFPFGTGIFNPEAGVLMLAPIGHPVGVDELDSKVEAAHLVIFLNVSGELVLKTVRVSSLQRPRRIVRGWRSRILHDIDRSVTEGYVTPI